MSMTIDDMIGILEEMKECSDKGGDAEVFLAEQPSWPFKYSIRGIVEYEGEIYIVEGQQLEYASKDIWEMM